MTPQKPVRTGKTVPAPPPQRVCVGDGGGGEEPGHPLLLDLSGEVPPPIALLHLATPPLPTR